MLQVIFLIVFSCRCYLSIGFENLGGRNKKIYAAQIKKIYAASVVSVVCDDDGTFIAFSAFCLKTYTIDLRYVCFQAKCTKSFVNAINCISNHRIMP